MDNDLEVIEKDSKDMMGLVTSRQAQEVQAAILLAKKFPRDEMDSYNKIRKACQRKGLAESAEYSYPRGGKKVTGASIRLAESMARTWGNLDCGVIELSREVGNSQMMAYAWDLETNTRRTMIFNVGHTRDVTGGSKKLTTSRDIYEMTANMGSRRLRACILAIIPADIVDDAVTECRKTLSGSYEEPLKDRAKKMLAAFEDKFQVSKEMIENHFSYKLEVLTENDYLTLISIFNSLKDGMSKREDWFVVKHVANSSIDKDPDQKKEEAKQ